MPEPVQELLRDADKKVGFMALHSVDLARARGFEDSLRTKGLV